MNNFKTKIYSLLRRSEKYTKTDMIYLTKGGFWLTLGQVIASASTFLLAIAFANLLPKETYGTYKYLQSTIGLLFIFALSGMGTALIPAVAKGYENTLKFAYKTKFRWALIGSAVSFGVALYYLLHGNYAFSLIYGFTSIIFPFWESASIYSSYLIAKTDFKKSTKFLTIQTVITSLSLVLASFFWHNFFPLLIIYLSTQTFFPNLFYKKTSSMVPTGSKIDQKVTSYAKHLSVMNILSVIADRIDSIILFQFLGPAQLAVYSFAIAIPEQIKAFVKGVDSLSISKFSQRPLEEIKKTIWRRMFYLFLGLLAVITLYVIFAPFIYKLFFPKYLDSINLSRIFSLSLIFCFITPVGSIFQAHQKTKELYIVNNVSSLILIISLLAGVYFYGLIGAIIGWIFSRFISALLLIWRLKSQRTSLVP
ncbi:MAG: oligosaccharide flippase family protein [Nanoarchaeota archaeon]|nr:oligosaccharide flippase family protein [Nanoarchaeota archaeon]